MSDEIASALALADMIRQALADPMQIDKDEIAVLVALLESVWPELWNIYRPFCEG